MRRVFLSLGAIVALALPANGWDTKEVPHEYLGAGEKGRWLSIYRCVNGGDICRRNEHELTSNEALRLATDGTSPWLIGDRASFETFDLNAELFKPDIRGKGMNYGTYIRQPEPGGRYPLERRRLPPAPHFASIPDISYTMYDWANKNTKCPGLPVGHAGAGDCHVFTSWHGARLNASHFGSQATQSYLRLHGTAISMADNAAAMMRAALAADNPRAALAAHKEAIQEAELLALAYEAAAQHYLGDRWAMGHMFERWGAPEYGPKGYGRDEVNATFAGMLTGLLHGYESVSGGAIPDAMSSPTILKRLYITNIMYTSEWRFSGDDEVYNGVGDYRLQDMKDGYFGGDYTFADRTDAAINVGNQRQWMMRCLSSGYGEIIRRFAAHPDGGYGVDKVTLSNGGQRRLDNRCFTPWATNFAMAAGWGWEGVLGSTVDFLPNVGIIPEGRLAFKILDAAKVTRSADALQRPLGLTDIERRDLVVASTKIANRAFWAPNGTDVAQGGLGSFGTAQTGNNYPTANYLEPASLDGLPKTDERGRDKQSIYGLFNRAGSNFMCREAEQRLPDLRGSTDPKDRALCRVLAQRAYIGVDPTYEGDRAERRTVDYDTDKREAGVSLCSIAGADLSYGGADTPSQLHPGYVSWVNSGARGNMNTQDDWRLANQSIANWCDQTPVIDTLTASDDRNADIAVRLEDFAEPMQLSGLNFGPTQGRLWIGQTRATAIEITEIDRWRNDQIRFKLDDLKERVDFQEIVLKEGKDALRSAFLFVDRVDPSDANRFVSSVGRFAMVDERPSPNVASVEIRRGSEQFISYEPPVEDFSEDPGAFVEATEPPPEPGPFRPIGPGMVEVEIEFDRDMDKDAEDTVFRLGQDMLIGDWVNPKTWRGKVEYLGGDFYRRRLGFQTLHVRAKADGGRWIDSDPETKGDQAFEDVRALVDLVPNTVERIVVRSGSKRLYNARWRGGPDLKDAPNLTVNVLQDPERTLSVGDRAAPPPEGTGSISVWLTEPSIEPPTGTVGGAEITFEGDGKEWRGEFDFAVASTVNGRTPILISLTDEAGNGLDADPRSVTQIDPDADSAHWVRYENARGGDNSPKGGADNWHFLSDSVDLSLVILLDGSGSMGEGTGRMENAKRGIEQTLSTLPQDQVIEIGGVIFYSCSSLPTLAFTRDIDAARRFFASASPTSWTSLAKAHDVAGQLFQGSADPGAAEWRYATFTDGVETCDGDVASAARRLDATIASRTRPQEDPEEDPPALEPLETIQCFPASWRRYEATRQSARPFNDIRLKEYWYLERALPDGRCFGRLETRTYGVYFGSGSNGSGWGINSRPSNTDSVFGSSSNGEQDLLNVRAKARTTQGRTQTLSDARARIASLVETELEQSQ